MAAEGVLSRIAIPRLPTRWTIRRGHGQPATPGPLKTFPLFRSAHLGGTGVAWMASMADRSGWGARVRQQLSGPFLFDDDLAIVRNLTLRTWWNLPRIFSPQRELPVAGRPLVNLSFALNYAFGGLNVRGYHVVNLGIHIACALVIFALVRRSLVLPRLCRRGSG
jgi:hypothetical protein